MSNRYQPSSSQWLTDIAGDLPPVRSLEHDLEVDVAVIGGGFVGLWTAIALKELEPGCKVAVLEQGRCGAGASGLNGGFVMSWWPKIGSLVGICGADDATWLAEETTKAVMALGPYLEQHGIDTEYRQSGWLWTATAPAHIGAWQGCVDTAARLGHGDVFQELPADEIARRTGSPAHIAGIFEAVNATVHPAKLGRGLATIAAKLGVEIYEETRVNKIDRTRPARIATPRGTVTAKRVVIATNAWAANVPELRRQFVCVGSAIVSTPPIPGRLEAIGWTGGESITDSQTTVTYYRTTRAGRLVFGKGGGRLYYTGEPGETAFQDPIGIAEAEADFRRVYPMLADVPLERRWSGPIDRTYDSLPLLGRLGDAPHIAYGIGWSGNGVNSSRIGGRILAGLVLERRERWTENGMVDRIVRRFPPEPFRYLGGCLVRGAMARKDRSEIAGCAPSGLDKALASLAPSGLEDKG
ncbi:MAG: FAD-dependent oxidoreductase [Rhodospirillaceae bacterium]|nr:MAG: FAD-dependent oxidoreductase [Rhodospirillaceae bacterium]